MHAWLKRAVAGLLSAVTLLGGGLLMAGTANADEIRMPDIGKTITSLTASAATTYPRELVNGGFDYLPAGGWNVISPKLNTSRGKFTSVDPVNGQYIRNAHVTDGNVAWVKWDGFDASKFGWISDQKGGKPQGFVTDHANSVELQRDNDTDNTYAEIVGSEIDKSIYQKIDTQNSTDAVYTVRFDHAALSSEHADGMQALVNGKPVTMTRIGGNKAGDKTGWTGTDIVTHATNTDHYRHDGQWATYEGKVTIPANTPVSTFMFKSLNEAKPDMGNLIDNLTFKIAYRLSYDSNGGTKAKASQISSRAEGKASETDGKVKTVADDAATVANTTNTLPDHLVNGDFEYPVKSDMPVNDGKFWYISQNDGSYFAKGTVLGKRYKLPEGFDKAKFAWHSTQTGDTSYPDLERADDVQVNYKADGTNHYSEINAAQSGATIYQDVATVPGVMYKWSLKHASLDSSHLDKMSVIIGEPGKETAQEATRTTANGHGDKLGKVGTVISTKVSNPEMPDGNKSPEGAHTGQWETYTGTYIATGTVTRFAFRSVEGSSAWDGNLLDDISFSKAYKLTYDKNASDATGKVPSNQRGKENAVEPAESKTTGNMKTVADNTSNLPDHLVNGTFDYRGNEIINENQRVYGSHDTTYLAIISAKTGIIGNPLHSKLDNWDSGKFGWKSNDATAGVDTVEVQRRNHTPYPTNAGNVWGEITAAKRGKYIYQDIATTPGVVYKWSLKHASRNAGQDDSMQVMIGEPGKTVAQQATRTTSNGSDKTGSVGTTITTHGTAQDGKWETYTGDYLATSTVTRFTFRSVRDSNGQGLDFTAEGNCVDDLSFDKAYKLSYDKNSSDATGSVPSNQYGKENTVQPAKSKTTGTVKTVADENVRYGSLANGDFSYPSFSDIQENEQETDADLRTFLKSDDGTLWDNMSATDLSKYGKIGQIPGFDSSRFAWSSTENGSRVELQQDRNTKNTYAEIVAQQDNTGIYQNVSTGNGGVLYKIRLKHASRQSSHADKMQVLVGSDTAHATPVEMTRVTSNGHGDKVGGKSTTITTKVSNTDPRDHGSQWETYEGYYQVPEGQKNTVFMFKSLEGFKEYETLPGNNVGNLVDDIEFSRSYKLTYDKNSSDAAGQVPSNQRGKENTVQPAKSKTTGSVGLAADKTASGLTVHDLKKNDKGKVPSSSKADSTQPAAFKAPDAKVETIASRAAGDELAVNGGFDTPKWTIAKEGQGLPWVYVTPNAGMIRSYAQAMAGQTGVKAGGLTAATFAWQDLDAIGSIQNFELHREKDGNTAADVHAGRTVAQTVNTTPGASYTFSIRHSGRSKGNAGGVTLLTGPDKDHLTPVRLTRTTVSKTGQKYGDKTGDVGTVAYTHSDSMDATEGSHEPWDHSDDWESYEGTVIIPAGQSRTMIAYRGVAKDGTLTASANDSIIDDLSFRLAYKLSYDANGGAKKSTSQIKASSDGTVKSIADKTSKVPVHDLEDTDVPGQYRDFILDTTKVKFSDVKFENGAWLNAPMPDSGDGATAMFPLKIGASATLPNVGEWTDGSGHTHSINAVISLHSWNGGSISQLWTRVEGELSTRKDLFWINTVGRNFDLPAQVIKALGGIDTSKRVGCQWTVNFTYEDGTPVPDTFRGVTGFNDLDGWDAQPDLKFEGVQLVSGFDGAYKTRDAELATYGVNGFAGAKHDSGPESNLDGKQQVKHRLAATWTGSSFTFGYDLQNPEGRDRGSRMTFGVPVTRTQVLTYKANGGTGQVPSHTEAGKVESASVKTAGSVHAISDATDTTGSAEGKAVSGVLTDTTVDAGDGTAQRTITRSDGSVRVETIADTGAVSGCQVYYPAGTRITLATAKADSDCWDSSQIGKTNRTFYGWSANTDANDRDVPVGDTMDRNTLNANVRTEIVMPARAKTVYALWAINPTLSYNVNAPAGSNAPGTPASQTVPYNTAAADKSGWAAGDTGKIPGYRFDGWYTAPNGGNKYDFNTPLTNNVTVYAHWVGNGYTVRFAGNGATGGGTPDQAFQYNIGQNLHRNGFVRDGYTFTGWKRADNQQAYGDGQWVTNLTTQPNGIVTMVAQWSANEAHIRYNPNPPAGKTTGGQGTPNWDGHTGDTPTIGQNGWTIDGYTFAGWATSPDGSGARYAPGARWTANGTLTLYAQWTPGQASLTYDGNGATGGKTDPQTGKTDEKINVRDNGFTRDGYTFVTWNTQADCKGNAVKPNSEWTLRGSSTLYACWAGNAQTLTYHGNGATGGNTAAQSGKTGDELTTNANGFTRDGYTFVRWDTAKDGSGTAYGEGKNGVSQYVMKPAGNDLYAIWKANPATIQYRNDWPNTTGSTPDTTGDTGDTVTISQNSFDRPGYTFTGWSTSKRGDPSLQPGDKHTLEPRTTTVWAQWKADPAHLVYNSNIGTVGSETKTVDGVVDQTVKTITNPFDRPGYTFSGWNTQADGKGKAYATGADYVLTANDKSTPKNTSVLYAQWKINGASLKFNPNGGIGHVDDVTGDAFSTVTIPGDAKEPKITRPGYRFVGWSTEKNPPAGSTFLQPGEGKVTLPAEGSTTVYAQWEPSLTTLPFTGGQAQVPTIWLYAGFALMLIALGVMMPMLRMRMAATKRTGKHMPITGGKHAK
ncbi:InlB B-repeat-containing protein [Bifidobacterium longum]|uniref:InlB B-repeat-containing protein n=1 Tax=Bifidobacterium longum TaxID=216816 RepID=UPI001E5EC238|nr:InlB B-repeat-containing protein [Bifidobacterium longum]MDB6908146.1 InlB B-repeat-containing protein [Bifidobacterium longum]MDB6912000.1 InlB B-repeat-containing protein [Bifidobacterium longum]MDB6913768.1 InlB B-repeat-containing protein [Bifidobacterium longum]